MPISLRLSRVDEHAAKRVLREQFFALLLDRDGALTAIPKMLPADQDARTETSERE